MENSHSPYPSPRHSSARSHSARSRKRALSLSPLSDGIGIDFNTIIRTSPTSLVAYINGSRASPANMSPQPEVYGHFLGVRGSCIPQPCSMPSSQKGVRVASSGPALPAYGEDGALEYERMQQLEHGGLQPSLVNNMVVQHGLPDPEGQPAACLRLNAWMISRVAPWICPRHLLCLLCHQRPKGPRLPTTPIRTCTTRSSSTTPSHWPSHRQPWTRMGRWMTLGASTAVVGLIAVPCMTSRRNLCGTSRRFI